MASPRGAPCRAEQAANEGRFAAHQASPRVLRTPLMTLPNTTLAGQPAGASTARRPGRVLPAWQRMLLGPPGPVRDGVVRLLYIAPSYLAIALLMCAAAFMGLAPWRQIAWASSYGLFGTVCFYAALRSGAAQRYRDPLLVLPHVCFSLTVVVLAYVLIPLTRGLAVQCLCLLILFDMRRLSGPQVLVAAGLAYGLLLSAMLGLLAWRPGEIDLAAEVVNIIMAGVTLCSLLAVTRVARRVHEQRKAQQATLAETVAKLDELAMRDGLTGLFNRGFTQELLEKELRRQARSGRPFCVAIVDIDHFKQVNDRFGHAVGDAVLRDLAGVLGRAVPSAHAVGRWGGEEFLVLMPECDQAQAVACLQAAAALVAAHDWARHAPGLAVSFSGGVSQHDAPAQPGGPAAMRATRRLPALLERADQALYAAKAAGRNRVLSA